MRFNYFKYFLFFILFITCLIFPYCNQEKKKSDTLSSNKDSLLYKNHADTARYVGMEVCRSCHMDIYKTFIETGMGKSFDMASKQKSSGDFTSSFVKDVNKNFNYHAYWLNDQLRILEFRNKGVDTVYKRNEIVDYIIGSGQHTNSHLQSVNGYLNQMPMTFYTQSKKWDLPPGFEDGHNSRFSRKIGLECMSCHNAFPEFILGSENKYASVPNGINCERCHGPGSIHVAEKGKGILVDTSKNIDYSIVNPAKLPIDLQFDICQRCHLQGNAILKDNKSFFDFKPGLKLNDFMTVFLPKYKGADDEFIMASHADRLKMSPCFIESAKKSKGKNKLKPYKDALTCVTCHNPHVSVRETNKDIFNESCRNCHGESKTSNLECSDKSVIASSKSKINNTINCVSCHMPNSGSIDIPHVSVHDHYIRKPISAKEKKKIKEFIGLFAINEVNPSNLTKAKAYINQYEKFEWKKNYLDSAKFLLKDKTINEIKINFEPLVQLYFIQNNYAQVVFYAEKMGTDELLNKLLVKISFGNENAWTCYRVGDSYYQQGDLKKAFQFLTKANQLAKFQPDFKEKLASINADLGKYELAIRQYEEVLKEDPKHITTFANYGFLRLQLRQDVLAEKLYRKGLSFDPDHEGLLMNMAGLMNYRKNFKEAKKYLEEIIRINPSNKKAKEILDQLKRYI